MSEAEAMQANRSAPPAAPLLSVRGLTKSFGGVSAVQGVNFDVAAGEMLALIGPNGAGKTTCFNMVSGQLTPDAGSVKLGGAELIGRRPDQIWRLGVGRTFQIAETFASLTLLENVQLALLSNAGRVGRVWRPARTQFRDEAAALLESVGMAAQAGRAASVLAYGDVKRVELAIALAHRPRLLLMDEPTAGMAPRERNELMALARRLASEQSIGVLFTEHSMDVVFACADRIVVLARGELIAEGPPAQVRDDAKVREVYFGGGTTFEAAAAESPASVAVPPEDAMVRTAGPMPPAAGLPTATRTADVLEVGALDAWYGRAQVLYGVDLAVAEGECVALVGRNGAGKSTTMKAIMGLLGRKRGRVVFRGADISALASYRIGRLGLGWVPEDRRIFTDLSVAENLEVARQPPRTGAPAWTPERVYALFPNLAAMTDRPGGRMSGGEQQMLTVARTLMGNPYLVLLDEPSEGVAPLIVEEIARMIAALKREGVAILLCEQNLHFAGLVADRAVLLEKGEVKFAGPMARLMADDGLLRTHLGV
ncbi:MAG TPA: ATP-binding cassette domain-containing protein [Caldimonas sp.]|nr:ATP-binding cassette domain-containing protein [Caldimonas sp.]